jgi:hypothetical protein
VHHRVTRAGTGDGLGRTKPATFAGTGMTSSPSALEIASLTDCAGHIALLHGAVRVGAAHDHLAVRRSAAWTSSRARSSITV